MALWFGEADPADAAWAVYLLSGRRIKRCVRPTLLREVAAEVSGLPMWLVEESYAVVGDLAETVSLLAPPVAASAEAVPLAAWMDRLLALRGGEEAAQRQELVRWMTELRGVERFVVLKCVTGALRVGVQARLVARAIAQVAGVSPEVIQHRLLGQWEPSADAWQRLVDPSSNDERLATPYPFALAHPLEAAPDALGDVCEWSFEWKWDGARVQVVRRGGEAWIWSRGQELLTASFPDLHASVCASLEDGVVLDAELVIRGDGAPRPFADLQRRLQRRKPGRALLEELPACLMAYDLLEENGEDLRQRPFRDRRARLEARVAAARNPMLRCSERWTLGSWEEAENVRQEARAVGAEGLMIKRLASTYPSGRRQGFWYKWKLDPWTVDAVLLYAQAGHGRRAGLATDYTLALWDGETLVPFAKAYSGLTDQELVEIDRWIRRHTLERFGPVRHVQPALVFEVAFEGLARSSRHRSGWAVRFPRIVRWRQDKRVEEADSLERLQALYASLGGSADGA